MRRLLAGLVLVVLALAGALALLLAFVPWEPYVERLATHELAEATGCSVGIAGPVSLEPGLVSEVRLASLTFAMRDGSPPVCRAQLGELDISLRVWGLGIEKLRASNGTIRLGDDAAARVLSVKSLRVDDLVASPGVHDFALALDLGDSRITGRISANLLPGRRPRIDAHLQSQGLRLADVGIEPRAAEGAPDPTPFDGWSDEPLDLEVLRRFDGTLVARATEVSGVGGPLLQETSFEGELERGKLSLRHISVAFDGGRLTGELRVDATASPPEVSLEADGQDVQLARLLQELEGSDAYSGELHGRLQLEGRGDSLRQLVGSLDGEFFAASSGGSVSTRHASLLTRDFFSVLRRSKRRASEALNCLVVDLGFAAGVGDVRWWVLDLEDVVVIGEGRVDLSTRKVDMRFAPKPRNPSPFSTAATIRVTGPVSAPTVKTEKGSLLKSSGKALLGTLPWLSGSRSTLRKVIGEAEFGRCREILR